MSAAPRKSLGRFEIVRVLGKGAMGIVYEGRDPRLDRRVAIKTILRSALLDEDAARDYAARFVREAQAVARLTHPHIVGVYDFGDEDDVTFIVMEYIDGRELKSFLDAGHRFDFPSTVRIMNELLDGLGYAHRQGVVHRDIKPANIMIDGAGRVKLTDFGVARITESAERTQVGTMVGTPSYMSPEQIQGTSTDNRTDLFACGVVLYQLLTGEKPFTGAGTWTIYNQILLQDPAQATARNPSLPPAIDGVVKKALAKDKQDRYRSAGEMAAALAAVLLGHAGEADEDATRFILPPDTAHRADSPIQPGPDASAASRMQQGMATSPQATIGAHEFDLEFWRAIKDSTDPADHELYVQKFPAGVYVELAQRKARRLRDPSYAAADATADPGSGDDASTRADADATQLAAHMTAPPHAGAGAASPAPGSLPPSRSGTSSRRRTGGAVVLAGVAAAAAWFGLKADPPPAPVAPAPVASTAVAPAASPAPARVDIPEASPQPAPVEPASPGAVKPAPSAAAGGAGNRVRPKEDPDALQRIESAIERASAEGAKETARKRVPERPN